MLKYRTLNIFLLSMFLAFGLNAQENALVVVELPEAQVDIPQQGTDATASTTTVDHKAKIEALKPKLTDDTKVEDIQKPWLAYIKTTEGKALIKRHNKAGSIIITFPTEERYLLTHGDIVDVGQDGRVEIEFKDKEVINLGPGSIVRMEQKGTYTLLVGSIRVRSPKTKEPQKLLVYAPNVNVATQGRSDFVVRYDDKLRMTSVACFDGKLNVSGIKDSKEQKGFDRNIVRGDKIDVLSTSEKDREVYMAAEPEKLSMDSKRALLESFYSDPNSVDSWEYTKLSTSFFRFAPSFEYARFREVSDTAYANFTLGYVPLVYLGSIFYLEPYFFVSFASPFDLFFYRIGAALQINPFNGFYLGTGGGAFWIHKDGAKYGADFTIHAGYTFAEKLMSFIDGFRLAYFMSQASGLHERAVMFSVIINFGRGRELY